jgi:hypothetical protein
VNLQVVVLPQNPCSMLQWARLILSLWVQVALAALTIVPLLVLLDQILCLVQSRHWVVAMAVLALQTAVFPMEELVVQAVVAQQKQTQILNVLVPQALQDRAMLAEQANQTTGQAVAVVALAVWAVMPLVTTFQTLQTAPAMAVQESHPLSQAQQLVMLEAEVVEEVIPAQDLAPAEEEPAKHLIFVASQQEP